MRTPFCILFCVLFVPLFCQNLQETNKHADTYFNAGDFESALSLYLEIYDKQPSLTDNIYNLAITQYERHNYVAAKYYFQQLIVRSNNFPLAYFYLGKTSVFLNEKEQAKQHFRFFLNNYNEQFPNESKLSKAYLVTCSDTTQYASISEIDIAQCTSCFGSTMVSDSTFITQCRTLDSPYLRSSWTNTLSHSNMQLFELLHHIKSDVTDVVFNAAYTKVYFSKCSYRKPPFCKIYTSSYANLQWSKPISLENDSLYSSQPTLINDSIIVFASNRAGTHGNMDLWVATISSLGRIQTIQNIGATVNTLGDEVTPYYDSLAQILYFSSDFLCGYGGLDVFSISYKDGMFQEKPENLNQPINSLHNDLYYKSLSTHAVVVSNRNASVIDGDSLNLNKLFRITLPNRSLDCSFVLYFSKNQPTDTISNYTNQLALLQINDSLSREVLQRAVAQKDSLLSFLSEYGSYKNRRITICLSGSYSSEGNRDKNIELALRRVACVRKFIEKKIVTNQRVQFEEKVSLDIDSINNFEMQRNVKIRIFEFK